MDSIKWQTNCLFVSGILLSLLGIFVQIGWWFDIPLFTQIHPSFIPMQHNSAVCFSLIGFSLISLAFNLSKLSNFFCLCIVIICLFTFLQYLFDDDLNDYSFNQAILPFYLKKMAVNTNISFLLSVYALFMIGNRSKMLNSKIIFLQGIIGIIIIGIGFSALVGYISGLNIVYIWSYWYTMAIHTSVGLVILGLTIFLHAFWMPNTLSSALALSLPFVVGLCFFLSSLWIWHSFNYQNSLNLKWSSQRQASYLKFFIELKLKEYQQRIKNLGVQYSFINEDKKSEFLKAIEKFIKPPKEIIQVSLYDKNFSLLASLFGNKFSKSIPKDIGIDLFKNQNKKMPSIMTYNHDGVALLRIFVPIFKNREFDSFALADIDLKKLIHSIKFENLNEDFLVYLLMGNKILYSNDIQNKNEKTNKSIFFNENPKLMGYSNINLYNLKLKIRVLPSDKLIYENKTYIPQVVLFFGFILSALGGLTSYFVQSNRKVIKALEESNKSAEAANIAKSTFLANVSHEIRTPLNGIIGTISLVLDSEMEKEWTEKQKKYLNRISQSGKMLAELINQILDYSKIEAGELKIENAPFSLTKMLKEVTDTMAVKAEEKGLELIVYFTNTNPIEIFSDSFRIKQILHNLIGNAIKFTEKGSVLITVDVKEMEKDQIIVEFAIKDTGIGINEQDRSALFKKFTQLDYSATRKFGGTGLGLAISKEIVEKLGGQIGCKSQFGVGSTFWFTIPCKKINITNENG